MITSKPRVNSRMITLDGEERPLHQWCKLYGVSPQLFLDRVKRGWDEERAITTPTRKYLDNQQAEEPTAVAVAPEPPQVHVATPPVAQQPPRTLMPWEKSNTWKPGSSAPEPKWSACNRLKADGRYAAFQKLKWKIAKPLIAEGMTRDEALAKAFYEALEQFPPAAE